MDEKMKMNGHSQDCTCDECKGGGMGMKGGMMSGGMWGGCGCGCGHHHHGHGWHVLVKIVILVIVFWIGMQFGEMRSYRNGAGMMQGYYGGYNQGYGPGGTVTPAGQ